MKTQDFRPSENVEVRSRRESGTQSRMRIRKQVLENTLRTEPGNTFPNPNDPTGQGTYTRADIETWLKNTPDDLGARMPDFAGRSYADVQKDAVPMPVQPLPDVTRELYPPPAPGAGPNDQALLELTREHTKTLPQFDDFEDADSEGEQ